MTKTTIAEPHPALHAITLLAAAAERLSEQDFSQLTAQELITTLERLELTMQRLEFARVRFAAELAARRYRQPGIVSRSI